MHVQDEKTDLFLDVFGFLKYVCVYGRVEVCLWFSRVRRWVN